jgi:hypothetical protein
LYDFQEDILTELKEFRYNICLKSRQLGISTLSAAFALWKMVFHDDYNILVIATKQEVAKNLVTKVRIMNDYLPSYLKINCIEDNKLSLKFSNGSQIKAASSSPDSARSEALSLLIIDEAAFVPKADEIWTAAQQTLSTGGSAFVLSCVTKDTLIFSDKGVCEVSEFIKKDLEGGYTIPKYNILGKDRLREGFLFHNNGLVDTKIIKTKYSSLEGSNNHKLWAYKNGKYDWFKLEDLSEGDFVSIQYGKNIWGNYDTLKDFKFKSSSKIKYNYNFKKIDKDLSYLFGLYISEGSSYKVKNKNNILVGGSITITCGDNISNAFNNLNIPFSCHDGIHYTASSKYLIELFEHVGFDFSKKAHQKEIPLRLLKMSRENIIHLLRGIFDGDGCVDNRSRVSLVSSSEKLINQVRVLLNNFGILSSKYIKLKENLNKYGYFDYDFKYDSYVLEINENFAYKYSKEISFNLNRKKNISDKFVFKERPNLHDVVPNSLSLYKEIFKKLNLKRVEFEKILGFKAGRYLDKDYKSNHPVRKHIIQLYETFTDYFDEDSYWHDVISSDIVWTPIKEIKNSKNETFDFSLPDNSEDFWSHSVIYNGFLGHQTPNGVGGMFHKLWKEAEEGVNQFNTMKLKWDVHPDRDQKWRDEQDELLGEKQAAQELDCSFITSGHSVIEGTILKWYEDNLVRDPLEKRGFGKDYWIFEYPDFNKEYALIADVARGDGSDYSAFHIIDIKNVRQVAEFKAMVGTREYARIIQAAATEYNNALVVVENANVGWDVLNELIANEYPNLFYTYKNDPFFDKAIQLEKRYDLVDKKNCVPGFTTTTKTRPVIISSLEEYFRDKVPEVFSLRLINELYTFSWDKGKAQAVEGHNDDLVMAFAIALWVRDTALRMKTAGIEMTKKSLDSFQKGIYKPSKDISPMAMEWEMKMPDGSGINLKDLL